LLDGLFTEASLDGLDFQPFSTIEVFRISITLPAQRPFFSQGLIEFEAGFEMSNSDARLHSSDNLLANS
jgi:hypothetical protein